MIRLFMTSAALLAAAIASAQTVPGEKAKAALLTLSAYVEDAAPPAFEPVADTYKGGTTYPAAAKVSLESFEVPVGANTIYVTVNLDGETANTVIASVRVFNGDKGRASPDTTKSVFFRPGDPLRQTVSFEVSGMVEGANVKISQTSVPDGGTRINGDQLATARAGAINVALPTGRAPMQFAPIGNLAYEATGATIKFDDKGGLGTWTTALAHGRTQVGNGESGYYGTVAMGGLERRGDVLAIKSGKLTAPVRDGLVQYAHRGQVLTGQRAPEMQFRYGTIEWEAIMPDRKDSWPALWLLPTTGWPPEIDVYEGFGYNGSWRFPSSLSSNLHGGKNNQRTFTRPADRQTMATHGLKPTLTTEFHKFATVVEPNWITMYVDGVETIRYANPFAGVLWYPLMNVAVKASPTSPYADGSGEMLVRSVRIWKAQ
ncbi:glycoside hydrolase family 16 protein [Sphingomonas qomolangmaensis]|uniref:Family 16 glycosylhydrolase n=1 Tax=Sphingomonas qomolangmaensis TaxID=2918765 RepID=A0ABY5L6K1_9SPHN|nr:family 16 glycosylhydrolase [Sphingomonas qomolangmaensis]UUL82407.1 family 16 glycosylhydrolase [Sphingomonas qomolangmaensis]